MAESVWLVVARAVDGGELFILSAHRTELGAAEAHGFALIRGSWAEVWYRPCRLAD